MTFKIKKSTLANIAFFFIIFFSLCCLDFWFDPGMIEKIIMVAILLASRTLGFVEGMSDD